jgi:hypothetical protein
MPPILPIKVFISLFQFNNAIWRSNIRYPTQIRPDWVLQSRFFYRCI